MTETLNSKELLAKHIFFFRQMEERILPLDVYIFELDGFHKYLSKGDIFTEKIENILLEKGQKYLFILISDFREYNFAVEKKLTETLSDENTPIEARTEILRDASVSMVEELFSSMDVLKDRERLDNLTSNMVGFLSSNTGILFNLLSLLSHAGLFHDLGKSKVSDKIINKKGPLNDEEWKIMKNHPKYSADLLKEIYGLHQNIIDAALYHHEKIDGTGYPFGLSGDKIPLIGRLTSISDIFSALTTHRSYSKARTIYEALNFMTENLKGKVDKNLFKKFIKMFDLESTNEQ